MRAEGVVTAAAAERAWNCSSDHACTSPGWQPLFPPATQFQRTHWPNIPDTFDWPIISQGFSSPRRTVSAGVFLLCQVAVMRNQCQGMRSTRRSSGAKRGPAAGFPRLGSVSISFQCTRAHSPRPPWPDTSWHDMTPWPDTLKRKGREQGKIGDPGRGAHGEETACRTWPRMARRRCRRPAPGCRPWRCYSPSPLQASVGRSQCCVLLISGRLNMDMELSAGRSPAVCECTSGSTRPARRAYARLCEYIEPWVSTRRSLRVSRQAPSIERL